MGFSFLSRRRAGSSILLESHKLKPRQATPPTFQSPHEIRLTHSRAGSHHELVQEIRGKPDSSLTLSPPLIHLDPQDPRMSDTMLSNPSQSPLTHFLLQRPRRLSSTRYAPFPPCFIPALISRTVLRRPRRTQGASDQLGRLGRCFVSRMLRNGEGPRGGGGLYYDHVLRVAVLVSAVLRDDVRESSQGSDDSLQTPYARTMIKICNYNIHAEPLAPSSQISRRAPSLGVDLRIQQRTMPRTQHTPRLVRQRGHKQPSDEHENATRTPHAAHASALDHLSRKRGGHGGRLTYRSN